MDKANLRKSEGCTTRCYHILNTRLHQLNNIQLTLYQIAAVLAFDGLFSLVEAIEFVLLLVENRGRGIDIFTCLVALLDKSSCKASNLTTDREEWEDHTPTETVKQMPLIIFEADTRTDECVRIID